MAIAQGVVLFFAVIIASTAMGGSPLPALLALCLPLPARGRWLLLASGLLLWLWVAAGIEARHRQLLPHGLAGTVSTVSGHVVGLPACTPAAFGGDGTQRGGFELLTTPDALADWPGMHRLRLVWYLPAEACHELAPGQLLSLRVRLRRPDRGDRILRDLRQGIGAHGVVLGAEAVAADAAAVPLAARIDHRRQLLSARLYAAAAGYPQGQAILPALVSGDRRGLDAGMTRTLAATGTAHLVAISGLHISLVVLLVLLLLRRPLTLLARLVPGAVHALPVLALAAAAGYAAMAGFAVATSRALAMTAVVLCLSASGRRLAPFMVLWLALALLLMGDPLLTGNAGLWMSVSAVYLLMLLGRRQLGVVRVQLLLTFALAPLAAWWFAPSTLGAWLANLILVPLFSLLVIPLTLLAAWCDPLLSWLPTLAHILALLWPLLEMLSRWPLMPTPAHGVLALAWSAAVVVLCLPGSGLPRWPLVVLLLPLCLPFWQRPAAGSFGLHVFDVGQGSAQAIWTRNHLLLFDAGPRWPGGSAAERIVLPWLRRQPQTLTSVVISHGDDDHAGGVAGLLASQRPVHVWSGEPHRVVAASPCQRGQRWRYDEVQFEVLWPPADTVLQHSNNRSCVLRVSGVQRSVLLSGDISRAVEYALVERGLKPVDLVQVPHHGSRSSSSFPFVRALGAEVAYTATAASNPFGHPHDSIVRRYRWLGARVFDTGAHGHLQWRPETPLQQPRSSLDQQWRSPWRWVSPVVE